MAPRLRCDGGISYSGAEYVCPMCERSTHAMKLDATLNETCRMIKGCLKPTHTNSVPKLAGIAPSDIRRAVASRTERTRQTTDQMHPLNGHLGVVPRLKSGMSSIKCTDPLTRPRKLIAWSYGGNDSSSWTPVCTLTSMLTNTSHLAQTTPGQPGRHSTGCVHWLAGQD